MQHAVRLAALTAAGLVWLSGAGSALAEDARPSAPPGAEPVQATAELRPPRSLSSSRTRARLGALRQQLAIDRQALERARARFAAGRIEQDDVLKAEGRVRMTEQSIEQLQEKAAREAQLLLLQRPVNIRLTDASLKQAAVAISQAAGLPVMVDADVPAEKRLTVDAKGVTLGLVLETLAQKADLMLAPDPKGIRMTDWPVIEVDGQKMVRRSDLAPWSEDWTGYLYYGGLHDARGPFASGGGVVISRGAPQGFAEAVTPPVAVPGDAAALVPQHFAGFPRLGGGVSISPLGDRNVVVAEPGSGPAGEAGFWLTVYRLEGERLKKVSDTFHPARLSTLQHSINGAFGPPPTPVAPRRPPGAPAAPPGATAPRPSGPPMRADPPAPTAPAPRPAPAPPGAGAPASKPAPGAPAEAPR